LTPFGRRAIFVLVFDPRVASSSAELKVGGRVQNWRILRPLATGSTGQLFVARHEWLWSRSAAVKVIDVVGRDRSDVAVARFHTEVQMHVAIRHPNVPDFYDATLLHDGTPVLLTELHDGVDLKNALARTPQYTEGDAFFIACELLRALEAIHLHGIHRDLKPSNIFLCRAMRFDDAGNPVGGQVRLLDFGHAKLRGKPGPTREGFTVGTNGYKSPEQIRAEELSVRSDLYSLGAVLYELLAGRPLFVRDRDKPPPPAILLKMHLTEEPDLDADLFDVPPDARAFVTELLAKDPGRRYPTAEAALRVARSFKARYGDSLRLFRGAVDDLLLRMRRLEEECGRAGASARAAAPGAGIDRDAIDLDSTSISAIPAELAARLLAERPVDVRVVEPAPIAPDQSNAPRAPSAIAGALGSEKSPQSVAAPATEVDPTHRVPATVPLPDVGSPSSAAAPLTVRDERRERAPLPHDFTTERATYKSRDVPEWAQRFVDSTRVVLKSPRCYVTPALRFGGSVIRLAQGATSVGSSPEMRLRLAGPEVLAHHATIHVRPSGEMSIVSHPESRSGSVRVGREPADVPTPITCGARLFIGGGELDAMDLSLVAAEPGRASGGAFVVVVHAPTRRHVLVKELRAPLTLIGSSPACDLELLDGPDIAFAVWLRGDGRVEVVALDTSRMPYGDTIVSASFVEGSATFALEDDHALAVIEPRADFGKAIAAIAASRPPRPHWSSG
jgi:hypothetical protein